MTRFHVQKRLTFRSIFSSSLSLSVCAHFNSSYLDPSLIPFGCYSARSSGTTNSMPSNLSVISCTLHSPPGATRKRSGKVGTKISLLII